MARKLIGVNNSLMSWQDRIGRISAAQEGAESARQDALTAKRVVAEHADALWENVATEIVRYTAELCEALPAAKVSDLRAARLNRNNVTVSTQVAPLLHFEIVYQPGLWISGRLRKCFTALEPWRVAELSTIRFTVDPQMRPWFTDGERYLHPTQVAEELMEAVAVFFEEAVQRPKIVA